MKLGVCIPYRDNGDGVRKGHLDKLIPHLEKFLGERGIDFTCYVGHQNDDGKFHRSGTKNIAYLEAKKMGVIILLFTMSICYHTMIVITHTQVIHQNISQLTYLNGVILYEIQNTLVE